MLAYGVHTVVLNDPSRLLSICIMHMNLVSGQPKWHFCVRRMHCICVCAHARACLCVCLCENGSQIKLYESLIILHSL